MPRSPGTPLQELWGARGVEGWSGGGVGEWRGGGVEWWRGGGVEWWRGGGVAGTAHSLEASLSPLDRLVGVREKSQGYE